ncbi:MAG: cyclase family protein [Geodermatophilaceae bacterium]
MKILDLSSPIDDSFWEPDEVSHRLMTPREGAEHCCAEMRTHFGLELDPDMFPGGEFLSNDYLSLTTHTGTHVDAPSHYGSAGPDGPLRSIDQMPLEWFLAPGMVLDLRSAPIGTIGADVLRREFDRIEHTPGPLEIVLLNTGADELVGTPAYFTNFVGLDGSAINLLLDLGVRVVGTDAFSLDAPFPHIIENYLRTQDPDILWPAHMIGRTREYCQLERLANLAALPRPHSFTVSCLPVKITGAGAGWSRVVVLLDEQPAVLSDT